MKFCWTTLTVNNLEESLKFYQEIIGLQLNRRFNAGSDLEIAFLGDGETKLELLCDKKSKKVNIGQDISLGFEVESVNKTLAQLKEKGIKIHSGPFQPNPNIKFFYLLDPNGLKVQMVENINIL
ncbi:MAG: VOC family protein [Actinobacteria bacterium]|jgi:lactoylglutathione lyase|nr:VOC family protein [Actinomycetota bacterium]